MESGVYYESFFNIVENDLHYQAGSVFYQSLKSFRPERVYYMGQRIIDTANRCKKHGAGDIAEIGHRHIRAY